MEIIITSVLMIANIVLSFFLKNKIFDLILRFLQNINKPLDYLVDFLEGSYSSIVRLSYKQQLYNFLLVIVAIVMMVSEYGTLNAVVDVTVTDQPLRFLGMDIKLSQFAAIAYITIATLIGFFALELIHCRKMFQGILYSDIEYERARDTEGDMQNPHKTHKLMRVIIFAVLFLLLIVLAYYQGELALLRFELSSKDGAVSNSYKGIITGFYFMLGFLTPVIASMALLSLDIFLAIVSKYAVLIIELIQKLVAAIYFAFEALIQLFSSPFEKLLELFGIFQAEKINNLNSESVKLSIRSAPLVNNNDVYIQNRSLMQRKYYISNIIVISSTPAFHLTLPSNEFPLKDITTFNDLSKYLREKYYLLNNYDLVYQFVDNVGYIKGIVNTDKIVDYLVVTKTVFMYTKTKSNKNI